MKKNLIFASVVLAFCSCNLSTVEQKPVSRLQLISDSIYNALGFDPFANEITKEKAGEVLLSYVESIKGQHLELLDSTPMEIRQMAEIPNKPGVYLVEAISDCEYSQEITTNSDITVLFYLTETEAVALDVKKRYFIDANFIELTDIYDLFNKPCMYYNMPAIYNDMYTIDIGYGHLLVEDVKITEITN